MSIVPASRRAVMGIGFPLNPSVAPLLQTQLAGVVADLKRSYPAFKVKKEDGPPSRMDSVSSFYTRPSTSQAASSHWEISAVSATHKPRLLVWGARGMGQHTVCSAVFHELEQFQIFSCDLPALFADSSSRSLEDVLVRRFDEAFRCAPSVLAFPHLDDWWASANGTLQGTLLMLLERVDMHIPVLILASSDSCAHTREEGNGDTGGDSASGPHLPDELLRYFGISSRGTNSTFAQFEPRTSTQVAGPSIVQIEEFFADILPAITGTHLARLERQRLKAPLEELEVAPLQQPKGGELSDEVKRHREGREAHHLRELRVFFREALRHCQSEKQFAVFATPVDPEDLPDYHEGTDISY
jgi:hypothetical protein